MPHDTWYWPFAHSLCRTIAIAGASCKLHGLEMEGHWGTQEYLVG